MTTPVPVPAGILSSDFPTPADRTAGVFNSKAVAWANSARDMSERDREIAMATHTNALSAEANALAAAQAAGDAVPAAATAVQKAQDAADSANAAEVSRVLAARLNLGPHSTPPTTDNEGQPLIEGATYWDTTLGKWRVWTGAAWGDGISAVAGVSSLNGLTGDVTITQGEVRRLNKSSAYTLVEDDKTGLINASGTWTLSLSPAASLGDGWWVYVRNTSNGDITIDPDGAETIDGQPTYVLKPGFVVLLQCDGAEFNVLTLARRRHADREIITTSTTRVVPPDTYVMRGYAVGAGGDGGEAAANTSSGAGGSGGGMAYGDIAVTPGETITIDLSARTAKVIRAGETMLVGNPAAHSTTTTPGAVGTASKHASVTNGGAYSGGLGGVGAAVNPQAGGGGGGSSGSPLGTGYSGGNGGGGNSGAGSGGGGFGGGGANGSSGGGGGGVGSGAAGSSGGGGLPYEAPVVDPLLQGCVAPRNEASGRQSNNAASNPILSAWPGQGGGGGGGSGGFGGGGGGRLSNAAPGTGGFGGGGGGGGIAGGSFISNGSNGGFGGGGGGGSTGGTSQTGGVGGGPAVVLFWG